MRRRFFIQSGTFATATLTYPSLFKMIYPLPYQMKLLRRNVGIFNEKGGTIGWLIQPDGIVVVDSQWKEQSIHLLEEIGKQQDGPVRFLINTHHHGDHTSGNIAFKDIATNILSHENSKANQMTAARQNNTMDDQLFPAHPKGLVTASSVAFLPRFRNWAFKQTPPTGIKKYIQSFAADKNLFGKIENSPNA